MYVCHVLIREVGGSQSPGVGVTSGSESQTQVLGIGLSSSGGTGLVLKHRTSSPVLRYGPQSLSSSRMLFLFSLSSALPYIFESGLLSEPGEYYSPFCLDWLARKTLGWFLLPLPHSAGVTGHRAQGTGRRVIHGSLHGCWGPEPRPSCLYTESMSSLRLPGTALLYLMTTSVSPHSAPNRAGYTYCLITAS